MLQLQRTVNFVRGSRSRPSRSWQVDVYNRGYSGFTTVTCQPLLPHVFPADTHNLLATVFFGANDASAPGGEWPQHVPVPAYEANLALIVQHVKRTTKVMLGERT